MKKDLAMKAIGYAVLFNFIVVLVPITVGIIDILKSSRPETLSKFTSDLICYSTLGCHEVLTYIIFVIELVIFSSVSYFISLRKGYSIAERKQLLTWFIITFPFAHYLMSSYVMGIAFLIATILKFGLVSIANY